MESAAAIPGYAYGSDEAARSPVSGEDLDLLKQTVLFGPDDERSLRLAGEVLDDQVDDLLDVWYGFVASHPHLVRYFADAEGRPIDEYLARVRARFGQWVHDLCGRPWDQVWLDYQEEIARRHTDAKKNRTDDAEGAPDEIPLRYLVAFVYPITATTREFLAKKGHSEEEVEAMHQAWFKAVTLSVALWSRPYVEQRW
jgi:Protoglobin